MRQLTETVRVGGQLTAADVARLSGEGFTTIINNRPDNEEPFQMPSDDLAKVCGENGIDYHHIPMSGGISPDMIDASIAAYANAKGPVAAFCKSGTRSTALWCFAHAQTLGTDVVLMAASHAGYELEQLRKPLADYLEQTGKS